MTSMKIPQTATVALVLLSLVSQAHGFAPSSLLKSNPTRSASTVSPSKNKIKDLPSLKWGIPGEPSSRTRYPRRSLDSRLFMSFNLPPGKNDNELGDILKSAGGLALVIAFFVSPVGGFVLGIFNSVLLLTILLPVTGVIGFSAWQYFNTLSGECPNCGAPTRVLKTDGQGEASPSMCYGCGSVLQANYENTGIDNITGKNSLNDLDSPFGAGSLFDIFGGGAPGSTATTSTSTTVVQEEKEGDSNSKLRRESTIIDVEVESKDKPWQ